MKRNHAVFLSGMLLYILSFFLPAIADYQRDGRGRLMFATPFSGFFCAIFPFSFWGSLLRGDFAEFSKPFSWVLLAVPLINPVFLITAALAATNRNNRTRSTLRIAIFFLFFIPIPVFYNLHLHPRIAYFLWMAAMLIVLFHKKLTAWNGTAPTSEDHSRMSEFRIGWKQPCPWVNFPKNHNYGFDRFSKRHVLKRNRAILLFGMLLYILSFFLPAVVVP
ncbi:MAG TPA: hypothetical protein VKZ53_23265 [Candidatus Angelobacter sp.]|nr:hypothetical protein [Candidatus Angelobacter sp.]